MYLPDCHWQHPAHRHYHRGRAHKLRHSAPQVCAQNQFRGVSVTSLAGREFPDQIAGGFIQSIKMTVVIADIDRIIAVDNGVELIAPSVLYVHFQSRRLYLKHILFYRNCRYTECRRQQSAPTRFYYRFFKTIPESDPLAFNA